MFQNLKIFKSPAEPVVLDDGHVVSGTKGAASEPPKTNTIATNLKDIAGPSKEDLEADFAFISDVLAKASAHPAPPPAAPQAATPTPASKPAPAPKAKSAAPEFVPMHKRGKNGNSDAPVFAVQSGPRSTTPAFLQDEESEADRVAREAAEAEAARQAEIANALKILGLDPSAFGAAQQTAAAPQEQPAPQVAANAPTPVSEDTTNHDESSATSEDGSVLPAAEAEAPVEAVIDEISAHASDFAETHDADQADAEEDDVLAGFDKPSLFGRLLSYLPAPPLGEDLPEGVQAKLSRDPYRDLGGRARSA